MVRRQGVGARGEELIEHRLRVAHAAGGEPGHQPERLGLGCSPVRFEDHPQLALDLGDGETPEVVALHARQDSRPDLAGVGRAEDEHDVLRRLLERLEQHVPAFLDPLHLVHDVDLAVEVRRGGQCARQELAHVVDPVVRGGVHLDHIERPALADRDAGLAPITRFAVAEVRAVERLGDDPRQRRLARAAGPDEQEGMGDLVQSDRVPEGVDHGLLTDDLAERLGAPAAVEGLVRSCRAHGAPGIRDGNGRGIGGRALLPAAR